MDTPGFSALDFNKYSKENIRDAFREFSDYPCPFKDCMHTKEKECVVKSKVLDNNILATLVTLPAPKVRIKSSFLTLFFKYFLIS